MTPMGQSAALLSDPQAPAVAAARWSCSAAQHALWQAAASDPRAALAQVDALSLTLDGLLDRERLEAALQQLGRRHALLGARFDAAGEPRLALDAALSLQTVPADAERPDQGRAAALECGFDLERGPLLHAHLFPLGARRHELLLVGHRLLGGRAGLALLLRELLDLYRERQLPLPLVDAAGTRAPAALAGDALTGDVELPTDRPRSAPDDGRAGRVERLLPATLPAAIERLAGAHRVEPAAVLVAAFAAWLERLTGERRLRFALQAVPRRSRLLPESLLELGVEARALCIELDPARPFAALLRDVAEQLAGAGDQRPLPAVQFAIEPAVEQLAFDGVGLRCRADALPRRVEHHELALALQVGGERWRLECHYRCALFEAATIEHWLEALETLLLGAVATPGQALARLPLLSAAARATLEAWQPPRQPAARPGWIQQRIDAICAAAPQRLALRAVDGELTYGALGALSCRLARRLAALGVGPGSRVGLCLERGRDLVPALLAVLRCGAAYVPLDPAFPPERLEFMVLDAGLALVISSGPLAERRPLPAPLLLLDRERAAIEAESAAAFELPAAQDDPATTPAYVIYTSGSTGMPKGVVVPHAAVANFLLALDERLGLAADTRLLAVTTLSFDIAVLELLWPLSNGATVVLATREQALDGRELRRLIDDERIDLMQAAPVGWRLLLEAGFEPPAGFRALCGGEALPAVLAERLGARCELWNLYGPTESTVWSTAWRVLPRAAGSAIGSPLRNTTVWVLDGRGQPCPVGFPGELYIGGDGLALGYLERPELTAQRFVCLDPRGDGQRRERLYRTGDRGRWASDGLLEHHGRLDDQVKLRGHRIELGEIEARLSAIAGVAESAVLLREDRAGDPRLVAYLVAAPGARLDPARIRVELRRFLPDYMVPAHCIELPALPRLPNRKLDRAALPSPLAGDHSTVAKRSPDAAPDHAEPQAELHTELHADPARSQGRLSADQARVWLLQALHADTVAFNRPSAHRLRGPLDAVALQQALRQLVERQASLRTVIERGADGQPLQRQWPAAALFEGRFALPPLFPPDALDGLPVAEREAELRERLQRDTDRPFDIEGWPLLRCRLYRLAEDDHVLLLVAHDLVCDEFGFDLLVEELAALYAAARRGEPAGLPALAVGYLDYVDWHAEWMRGAEYARQRAFWTERLGRVAQAPMLPTDHPRQLTRGGRAGHEWVRIPRWLTESLETLARDAGTSLSVVLLAAFATLLARFAGHAELVIGLPQCGRRHPRLARLVGQFTKLLPLPVTVAAEQSFLGLLRATEQNLQAVAPCADVQLEDLVAALPAAVAANGSAYHALFSMHDVRGWPNAWAELQHEPILVRQQGCCEDLGLRLVEHADGISGALQFDASRFERATAALLRDQYLSLIARIVEQPGERIATLWRPAAFEADRLAGWGSGRPVPEVAADSLTARFRRACAERPQAVALVEAGRNVPYRVLGSAVAGAALQLRGRIWSGEVVAVALPHGFERTVAILACLSVGGVCLLLDPARPLRQLAQCLALVDRGREGGRNGSSIGAAGPWLIADRPLAHTLRWPARRRLEPVALQRPGDLRSELQRSPASSSLLLPLERADAPLALLAVPERMLLALDSGLREAGLFGEQARVAALAAPDAPRSLIESLLPLVAGAAVVVEPQRQGLAAWLESAAVNTLIADAQAWQREFDRGWRGRDGLATVADGVARAQPGEPDHDQLRGQHWHAFGDPQAGLWSLLGPANGIARVLPARRVRVEDRGGQPAAIGAYGTLRLGADGHVGSPAAEILAGRARWRADGSLELEAAAPARAPLLPGLPVGAAETPLQALLHDLWSEVLGHAGFGVDDSFFDLGGHSLIAVRMFQQAERKTGVNLPLSTLYRAPTIRALAAAFAAAQSRVSDHAITPHAVGVQSAAEDLWRPLVPIRPAGRQRPLFLVHAIGGNVMNYRVLVDALPADQPVYGLQAVGLDGRSRPLRSIAAMAERYLEEILAVQAQGPYRLGGGSMGGVIAFEIARRLRARGETVELLALIDSELPGSSGHRRDRLLDRLRQWRASLAVGPRKLGARLRRTCAARAAGLADRARIAGCQLFGRALPHGLRYRHVEAVNRRACAHYRHGPYDGPITLFLASDGLPLVPGSPGQPLPRLAGALGHDLDPSLGWRTVAGARLTVIPVGGTHNDVIGRASLAAALVDALAALPATPAATPGDSA